MLIYLNGAYTFDWTCDVTMLIYLNGAYFRLNVWCHNAYLPKRRVRNGPSKIRILVIRIIRSLSVTDSNEKTRFLKSGLFKMGRDFSVWHRLLGTNQWIGPTQFWMIDSSSKPHPPSPLCSVLSKRANFLGLSMSWSPARTFLITSWAVV